MFNRRNFDNHFVDKKRTSFVDDVSMVNKYGYIPARKQIENLILSGKRLDAFRTGMYMYDAGGFDKFSEVDFKSENMYYVDKLSAYEQSAFIAGVRRATKERLIKAKDDEERKALNLKYNQILDKYNKFLDRDISQPVINENLTKV